MTGTDAQRHAEAFTQKSLHRGAFTRRSLLHSEASTQRSIYADEDFTQRSLCTNQLLQTDVFTHRSFYTQKLWHGEAFTKLCAEELLHAEAFTQRIFSTQTHLHTEALARKRHDTEELLHTEVFTHRSFYPQTLLHTASRFYLNFVGKGCVWDFSIAILPRLLTFGPHFVRRGCIWSCKLAIFYWSFSAFPLHEVKSQFNILHKFLPFGLLGLRLNLRNSHLMLVFDIQPWCRAKRRRQATENSDFTTHSCVPHARSPQRVARTQDTFAFHDTFGRPGTRDLRRGLLAPKTHLHFTTHLGVPARKISAEGCLHPRHICISRHIWASRHARSPQRVARTQDTFAFRDTLGRPGTQDLRRGLLAPPKTHLHFTAHLGVPARKIFTEGCSHPRHIAFHDTFASRHARSPQRVARTQDTFAFHDTFGRPGRHDLRRGLLAPKTHLHFTMQLGIPAGKISAESCSHPRHICISRHIWASRHTRSSQRVARTQDTFAFHDAIGRPGTHDLRRGLLAPKTHLHFTTHLGVPACKISAEGCSHPRHICISRHIWQSRHTRSPQRVARTQDTFAFHNAIGHPGRQDLRRELLAPKTHLHFTTHLAVPAHTISAESCSHPRHICISRHIWQSRHTRSPQRVARTQDTFAFHDAIGHPGRQDLRRELLAPKTHLHFTTHLGVPADTISAEGCSHPRHICISRCNWASRRARSPQRVARTQDTFAFHDAIGPPGGRDLRRGLLGPKTRLHFTTHLGVPAHTISAEGCLHPRHICISRHIWASRHARSSQRVARTQDTFAFHDAIGPPGGRDLRRGLLGPKTRLHFTTHLGVPAHTISAEGCLHPRHICISRHIWASRHARSSQRVARTQDTFAFHGTRSPQRVARTQGTFALHDTFGCPGTQDLRKGLLAPKTHLHLFHDTFGRPASTISTEGCVL